ncbi:TlpA family protein disulfide reductase [Sideroxydans lithotrophicus]|uniref:Alkyl hydroperoxide reductase/ Thiol specific antioxidant/ Mal allergen n=1 Tax=Sideroxydans lithotrophicus (strain ES-1) TaxID=580332 RepID=D5CNS0_SIDLE|nr:TlpA disulfide reductase family protein [Sideroxydans lithotrophicus]ADE10983.1 alkyl hydroperoxide reductase/ Thiol specific antioxidant/ Mal allergen [Sideroxydans lithotrophicus ES-1]
MRFFLRLLGSAALVLAMGTASAESFVFKDLQGHEQRLQDYRGKWVLVNFWATWCPPCLEEIPDLVSLYDAHKNKDLTVIGVSLDSTRESVVEFVAKKKISYPVVFGDYDQAAQVGEVDALPTSYLYDPDGKLVSYQQGMVTRSSVESYIKSKTLRK